MKTPLLVVSGTLVVAAAFIAACTTDSTPASSSGAASSSSSGGSSGGASSSSGTGSSSSGASGGNALTLADADKPGVTPCPTQDSLKDEAAFATLKTAVQTGAITYLDIKYNAADQDILKKKCGLEGFWDPTKNTDVIPVSGVPLIANILMTQNGGICSQGFSNFGSDEGFPVAGVYRKEFKAASGGKTYHLRVRATASGSAAGKKFSEVPLAAADFSSKVIYQIDGVATPHADVWKSLIGAMKAPVPAATLDVQNGGSTIFSVKNELICVAVQ